MRRQGRLLLRGNDRRDRKFLVMLAASAIPVAAIIRYVEWRSRREQRCKVVMARHQ